MRVALTSYEGASIQKGASTSAGPLRGRDLSPRYPPRCLPRCPASIVRLDVSLDVRHDASPICARRACESVCVCVNFPLFSTLFQALRSTLSAHSRALPNEASPSCEGASSKYGRCERVCEFVWCEMRFQHMQILKMASEILTRPPARLVYSLFAYQRKIGIGSRG